MGEWREALCAGIVHWRCTRNRIRGRFYEGRGHQHFFKSRRPHIDWDDFEVVPKLAHNTGLKAYLYVSLFDEGWPLLPKKIRETSYHNAMHCQHVSWQSRFSRKHPEYTVADRKQKERQWGVLCLAYPEVRQHLIGRYERLLMQGDFDGLFVCLRSQSKPAAFADQFGFNDPIRNEYLDKYGVDIWVEDFNLGNWRNLLGEYLTRFFIELKNMLRGVNIHLSVGLPRGNILGPPLGNATLYWPTWVEEAIVDDIVIDQNSSRCPSMWHDLWPMHRGSGYVKNPMNRSRRTSLEVDLSRTYEPALHGHDLGLYVARQWHERSHSEEQALLGHPVVQGLVFGSFRHDNPGPIQKNDWSV
jgi:hypothetical protein